MKVVAMSFVSHSATGSLCMDAIVLRVMTIQAGYGDIGTIG